MVSEKMKQVQEQLGLTDQQLDQIGQAVYESFPDPLSTWEQSSKNTKRHYINFGLAAILAYRKISSPPPPEPEPPQEQKGPDETIPQP